MRRRRRRLWALGICVALVALALIGGWSPTAGAAPSAPADPSAAPAVGAAPPPGGVLADDVPDCGENGETAAVAGRRICKVVCHDSIVDFLPGDQSEEVRVSVPGDGDWRWYVKQAWVESTKLNNCALARHQPDTPCPEGRLSGFPPDNCWGDSKFPMSRFNLGYKDSGFSDFTGKIVGNIMSFAFAVGRGFLQVALWLVGAAFEFNIRDYTSVATDLGKNYKEGLVDQPLAPGSSWTIDDVVWFVLICYAGFAALRGRIGVAGGEIALSIVVVALAVVLVQNRAGYMEGTADLVDDVSSAMLLAGTGREPGDKAGLEQSIGEMQKSMQVEFVEQPYDYLNWGSPSNVSKELAGGECLGRRNQILEAGLVSDGGWAERYMQYGDNVARENASTCSAAASAFASPITGRFWGGVIAAIVAVFVAVILALTAMTVVIAKITVVLLFAVVPLAAVAAALPGAGRRLAWSWVSTLLQMVLVVTVASLVLSFLLLGVQSLQKSMPAGNDLTKRWFVLLLFVGIIYAARKRLLASTQQVSTQLADKLPRLSPAASGYSGGGPVGWNVAAGEARTMQAAGRAGLHGAYVGGIGAAMTARAGGKLALAPLKGGKNYVFNLRRDRRNQRFGDENLQKHHLRQLTPTVEHAIPLNGGGGAGSGGSSPPPTTPTTPTPTKPGATGAPPTRGAADPTAGKPRPAKPPAPSPADHTSAMTAGGSGSAALSGGDGGRHHDAGVATPVRGGGPPPPTGGGDVLRWSVPMPPSEERPSWIHWKKRARHRKEMQTYWSNFERNQAGVADATGQRIPNPFGPRPSAEREFGTLPVVGEAITRPFRNIGPAVRGWNQMWDAAGEDLGRMMRRGASRAGSATARRAEQQVPVGRHRRGGGGRHRGRRR